MERYRETMSPAESIVRWNEVDEHSGADGLKRSRSIRFTRVKC